MNADIFIPTAGNVRVLKNCLDSLNEQTCKNFSIIIVVIRQDPQIDTLITQYPNLSIMILIQSGKGLVQAAQDAYLVAKNDIFIRIDDYVVTDPHWLENIIKMMTHDPMVGGVTGPTLTNENGRNARDLFLFFEKTKKSNDVFWKSVRHVYLHYIYEDQIDTVGKFLPSGAFTLGSNYESCLHLTQPLEVDNLEACNMAIRKSLLDRFGGFDLTFNRGLGEYHEADIACKIKKAGYKVLFSSHVRLEHRVESTETASGSRPDSFYRIANFIAFYKRHLFQFDPHYIGRFATNILFQNGYYLYKFATTRHLQHLGSIPGTMYGLLFMN